MDRSRRRKRSLSPKASTSASRKARTSGRAGASSNSNGRLDTDVHAKLDGWNMRSHGYHDVNYGPLHALLWFQPEVPEIRTPRYSMNARPSAIVVKSLGISNEKKQRKGYGRRFMEAMFAYGNRTKKDTILELTITDGSKRLAKSIERTKPNGSWSIIPSSSTMVGQEGVHSWIYKHKPR
eukprot:1251913-Pleurochrysis_carterae.AAC.2